MQQLYLLDVLRLVILFLRWHQPHGPSGIVSRWLVVHGFRGCRKRAQREGRGQRCRVATNQRFIKARKVGAQRLRK
jgi:hypothetical protein